MQALRQIGWTAAAAVVLTLFAAAASARPLTVDDVLDLVRIDQVALSPDRAWVAAVVQRPARAGEVFGRAAIEVDPSRSDVWLISRVTGERRNLTDGAALAAGFWCAAWSPDGRRLAMLATRPEGAEPRGGDNVRLYVWDRESGALSRLSDTAVMTQTRYGSPMYGLDLRGGAMGGTIAARCGDEENAPFLWLDDRRLLAVTIPEGEVSGLLDEHGRPARHTAATAAALLEGRAPTVSASGSGEARVPEAERTRRAILRTFDVTNRGSATVAEVPVYPFRGELTVSISPDRRRLAVLATVGAIQPSAGQSFPYHDDTWTVEKRLRFIDFGGSAAVRWASAPAAGRHPLELLAWSPDSRRVALRARATGSDATTSLFLASAETATVAAPFPERLALGTAEAGSDFPHEAPLFWVDSRLLVARLRDGDDTRWWLVGPETQAVTLTGEHDVSPEVLRRGTDGRLYGIAGGRILTVDVRSQRFAEVPGVAVPHGGSLVAPVDPGAPTSSLVLREGEGRFRRVRLDGGREQTFSVPASADLMAVEQDFALWRQSTGQGLFLRESHAGTGGGERDLLAVDSHLAEVDWGEIRVIDYRSSDGEPLRAQVILPPGYREGQRYPLITWVYPRTSIRGPTGYFLDRHMGGFYNLYLYAARGYVVLIPSMPLRREGMRNDTYLDIPSGVLPAVERLVELGIADPDRVGVMGQSFGGYAVYALVTQTRRFRAAVAMAGIVDVSTLYGEFDRAARGYPGVEHEKSDNWSIVERGAWALGGPPEEDRALFARNSPINYVERVETPLLMIHGEYDKRGSLSEAERFFYALHRRGRTARLLRYWGESHSLAQSPANVRNIYEETVAWFDRWLAPRPAAPD